MTTLAPSPSTGEDDPWATTDALLTRVASGDQLALAELYDLTSQRVYGLLLRAVKNPALAETMLQDVYVEVWTRAIEFYVTSAAALPWLGGIVRRRLLRGATPQVGDGSAVA